MKGDRTTIAGDQLEISELVCTGQIYEGRRAYKRDPDRSNRIRWPGTYDVLLCGDPVQDPASLIGRQVILGLEDGRVVFAELEPAGSAGRYDLHHPFAHPMLVERDVSPLWAAPLACAIVGYAWDEMVAKGRVWSVKDGLH